MRVLAAAILTLVIPARGEVLIDEDFATDPIGSRASASGDSEDRYFYSLGQLTVHYDLLKPHSRLSWALPSPLTDSDDFTATITFELGEVDFDDFNLCQISFGFINQENTGHSRTISPGDSWELMSIDYFPGAGYPSYTPTFIRQRPPGGGDALTSTYLKFPQGSTSLINDFGEIGALPEGVPLTTTLSYQAESRMITVSLADPQGGLAINALGADPDGDESTIQLQLDSSYPFEFDAFSMLLWEHFQGGEANLILHSLKVETPAQDLLTLAFPEGAPSPIYAEGRLSLTYLRDLTQRGFTVAAEHSDELDTWRPVAHTVLSSGPAHELRQVSVESGYLRLRVTAQ